MTELASINAIVRRKEGRRTRYFMNPNIATHIPTPEQRAAARDAAGPLLVLMQGARIVTQPPRPALHHKGCRAGGVYGGG